MKPRQVKSQTIVITIATIGAALFVANYLTKNILKWPNPIGVRVENNNIELIDDNFEPPKDYITPQSVNPFYKDTYTGGN